MNVALISVTGWFALSLLFAAVHKRWIHYTPVALQPLEFGTKVWRDGATRHAMQPAGSDVSAFFRSYVLAPQAE